MIRLILNVVHVQYLLVISLRKWHARYSMLDFKSPYQQLLYNCGQSTFLQRLQKLMEVIYRILNGLYPSYLNDVITVEELQHLRCQARLLVPRFSTIRYGKKEILSYLSPVLWNTLDTDIKQCNVLTAFKKRMKLWKGPTCNCGFCAQCRISNR